MTGLSLAQRLLLASYLERAIASLRKDELYPLARQQWRQGERQSVTFAGRDAGWASLPKASTTATVTDEAKLLAWAEKTLPAKVADEVGVIVDDDLIGFLREHRPQSLRTERKCDPDWVADVLTALKGPGYYVTSAGEKVTELPGVLVSTGDPSPRVNLAADASDVIRQAWRAGLIPAGDLLALEEVMPGAPVVNEEPGVVSVPGPEVGGSVVDAPCTGPGADDETPEQYMPHVNGKPFRCPCGCKALFMDGAGEYRCNGCGEALPACRYCQVAGDLVPYKQWFVCRDAGPCTDRMLGGQA